MKHQPKRERLNICMASDFFYPNMGGEISNILSSSSSSFVHLASCHTLFAHLTSCHPSSVLFLSFFANAHYHHLRFQESKCTYGACLNVSFKEVTRSLSSHIHLEIGKELDICKSRCIHSTQSSLFSVLIESSFVTIV